MDSHIRVIDLETFKLLKDLSVGPVQSWTIDISPDV